MSILDAKMRCLNAAKRAALAGEAAEQVTDDKRPGDRGNRAGAYRVACGFGDLGLRLLRLLGNARCPIGSRRCGVRSTIHCAMDCPAHTVDLRGRLIRDAFDGSMRSLRHTFDSSSVMQKSSKESLAR